MNKYHITYKTKSSRGREITGDCELHLLWLDTETLESARRQIATFLWKDWPGEDFESHAIVIIFIQKLVN